MWETVCYRIREKADIFSRLGHGMFLNDIKTRSKLRRVLHRSETELFSTSLKNLSDYQRGKM
jgi:hypothetical protein